MATDTKKASVIPASKRVVPPLPVQWFNNVTQKWGVGATGPNGEGGHPGTDYGAPAGTPVYSIADGVVIYAGFADGFGYHAVSIWHEALGISTTSGHMQANYVNLGDTVKAGQAIGEADNQGYSQGNHLHHEVRPVYSAFGGNPMNIDGDAFIRYCMALQAKADEAGTTPEEQVYKLTKADKVKLGNMQDIFGITPRTQMWCVAEDNAMKTLRTRTILTHNKRVFNDQVRRLQWRLFEFSGHDVNGWWDDHTEKAYQLSRYVYLYKT